MSNVELKIGGMTCQGCVRSVQRKLAGLDGVDSAAVDLAAGRASVVFDEARIGPAAMVGAVVSIGFQASES